MYPKTNRRGNRLDRYQARVCQRSRRRKDATHQMLAWTWPTGGGQHQVRPGVPYKFWCNMQASPHVVPNRHWRSAECSAVLS